MSFKIQGSHSMGKPLLIIGFFSLQTEKMTNVKSSKALSLQAVNIVHRNCSKRLVNELRSNCRNDPETYTRF